MQCAKLKLVSVFTAKVIISFDYYSCHLGFVDGWKNIQNRTCFLAAVFTPRRLLSPIGPYQKLNEQVTCLTPFFFIFIAPSSFFVFVLNGAYWVFAITHVLHNRLHSSNATPHNTLTVLLIARTPFGFLVVISLFFPIHTFSWRALVMQSNLQSHYFGYHYRFVLKARLYTVSLCSRMQWLGISVLFFVSAVGALFVGNLPNTHPCGLVLTLKICAGMTAVCDVFNDSFCFSLLFFFPFNESMYNLSAIFLE